MADTDVSRLSRLTAILTYLQSKRLVTATAIAKKFNISIRTVYRDIRALESAGVPILTEEGKGYTLMDGYILPPLMLTEAEVNALITAEQLVLKNKDASFVQHYTEATTKIKALLRYNTKDKAELLAGRIQIRHNISGDTTSNFLSVIQLSITNCTLLKIEYKSIETRQITKREIESLALYSTSENWILIAWCRMRKALRSFRLDQIQQLHPSSEKFQPHDFDLEKHFENCRKNSFANP
ncbi:MAG: YafY family transcriptional regulator [Chitinophagaceae bacterium]|nr:YafY family transcriptional regulator [Chitinophagaceae bacterium]